MLITCQECKLQVSDKAVACPHCGFPMKPNTKKPTREKSRLRLPNGFGQISKVNNARVRNRYRAMVTVGYNSNGRPICKPLKPTAYFPTYNDAYNALVEYNRNPYDFGTLMTFEQLYEKWSTEYFAKLSNPSSVRTIKAAWKHLSPLYKMDAKQIRARHIKGCIEDSNASDSIKARMKSVCNLMLDFAVEYEIVDKNYARDFKTDEKLTQAIESNKKEHVAFSDEELAILWKHSDDRTIRMLLIQVYMGWRPQELCLLEAKNIKDGFITGGMKTEAGKNRTVPIHSCIKKFIVPEGKHLFEDISYDKYRTAFNKAMEALGIENHRLHDGRKTFITLAKKYEVDEYAIKRIVGHAITDITEKIYTERDPSWLVEEIEKIKGPAN